MEKCAGCGKEGENLKACTRCHGVKYCDKGCQRGDWRFHKPACRAAPKSAAQAEAAVSKGYEPEGMTYERMRKERGARGLALVLTDQEHRDDDIKAMQRWLNEHSPIPTIAIMCGYGLVNAVDNAGVKSAREVAFVGVTDNAYCPIDSALLVRMSGFAPAAQRDQAGMLIYARTG